MAGMVGRWRGGDGGAIIIIIVVCFLFPMMSSVDSQTEQPSLRSNYKIPLAGQMGLSADSGHLIPVHVSFSLDRLLKVDEVHYKFGADVHIMLTWVDNHASLTIAASYMDFFGQLISVESIAKNCTEWLNKTFSQNGVFSVSALENYAFEHSEFGNISMSCQQMANRISDKQKNCKRFCSSFDIRICCDSIYLPSVEFTNLVALPLGQPTSDDVLMGSAPDNSTFILRVATFQGEFSTPLAFQRFPYDTQTLEIIVAMDDRLSYLVPSALGKNLGQLATMSKMQTQPSESAALKSDELTGWSFSSMRWQCVNDTEELLATGGQIEYQVHWADSDPYGKLLHSLENVTEDEPTNYNPRPTTQCKIIIEMVRNSRYYFWNMVFPVAITVIFALAVLASHPSEIELRLSSTVALLLALVAVQFTTNSMLPSSSYLTDFHKFIIVSYCMMGVILLINIITARLVIWAEKDLKGKAKEEGGYVLKIDNILDSAAAGSMYYSSEKRKPKNGKGRSARSRSNGYYVVHFPLSSLFCGRGKKYRKRIEPHVYYRMAIYIDRFCLPTLTLFYVLFSRYIVFEGKLIRS